MTVSHTTAPYRLVLLRHGESVWNQLGLFTGWVDVDLTDRGIDEAAEAGRLLAAAGLLPDLVHTSLLGPGDRDNPGCPCRL